MKPRKYRWSKVYESAEEELLALLQTKGIAAQQLELGAGELAGSVADRSARRIWCVEGSIVFTIDGQRISLQPGDALDIPADVTYEALAGISGCTYYTTDL